MMDYKLIEAMAMVVREGGFDRAASFLNITQSAVSQRVKLLEDQTGQVLLARTTPPTATPAGKLMLKHYLQVRGLEEDLKKSVFHSEEDAFVSLAIGLNADSLATWFLPSVDAFMKETGAVFDLLVDDQEQTHKMLRDGTVSGCISSRQDAVQGCSTEYLGSMNYRLAATPEFVARFFPQGIDAESVKYAPAVIFNRRDNLHSRFFIEIFGRDIPHIPVHYVPSSEKFAEFIISGYGYGMIPDLQSRDFLSSGELADICPSHHISVELYWHSWNLKSELLEKFTHHLTSRSEIL